MKKIVLLTAVFSVMILSGCTSGSADKKLTVIEKVTQLFVETDNKNWKALEDIFTEEILFDMSSMTGQKASKVPAINIINAWKTGLKDIEQIHHQTGNYMVKLVKDGAEVFCYGIASHYKSKPEGNNTRTFVGSYNFHLIETDGEWKIDSFRFNLKYITGNKNL